MLGELISRSCVSQEQDACADAEDRATQLQKEKEKLEDQIKVRREKKNKYFLVFNCVALKHSLSRRKILIRFEERQKIMEKDFDNVNF